ncbi:MAG: vitamin K epoxide reductase family protein [Verrucomicrobiota bacterium]
MLVFIGLTVNGLLLFHHLSGVRIAGCGAGGACDDMLNSQWAVVLGVPISMAGMAVYLVLLISFVRKSLLMASICLGGILGAAVWFVFLQAVIIGRFCPWCMTGHTVGLSLVGLTLWRGKTRGGAVNENIVMGAFAVMAAVGIAGLQYFGPRPVTHQLDDTPGGIAGSASGIHARGNGRKVKFGDGDMVYDVSAMPHLGRPDATHVLVEYFDYQCSACRIMRGFLSSLIEKHPDDLCVLVLPVPLDRGCNASLPDGEAGHPGSCALTRIALAVWRLDPDAYPALHRAFLSDPPPDQAAAMALATAKVPADRLEAAMRDPWIDELIQADIADWVSFSATTKHLPKLLITQKRILHGLPSGEADFIRVMEQELGL